MGNFIESAARSLGEFYIEEVHLKPLLDEAWNLNIFNYAYAEDIVQWKLIELLRGDNYSKDRKVLGLFFPFHADKIDDVTELLIVLRWRELSYGEKLHWKLQAFVRLLNFIEGKSAHFIPVRREDVVFSGGKSDGQ